MGLGELVSRLERDADARIAQLRAQARAEVEAIDAQAGRASAVKQRASLSSRGAERRKALERELATVRAAARAARLQAQHAVLARVKARAAELLLAQAGEPAAQRAVAEAFREALRYVEGQQVVVRCAPGAAEALRPLATPQVRFEVADAPPGFALATADGRLRIDGALAARLEARWPTLAMELVKAGEEPASPSPRNDGERVGVRGLLHQPPKRGEGQGKEGGP